MPGTTSDPMRLSLPTDRLILGELVSGRNLAANIAKNIDRNRNYINERMSYLRDYRLVDRVGPVETTGLYELTARGAAVVDLADDYEAGPEFEALVDERAERVEIVPFHYVVHPSGDPDE